MSSDESPPTTSGVQDLIDRIRDDGVKAAQSEADRIVREAERRASNLVAEARRDAEKLLEQAHAKIGSETEAAKQSLRLAARDTIKELSSNVRAAFERQVERLVTSKLEDEDLLKQLIVSLAVKAGEALPQERPVQIILGDRPANVLAKGDESDTEAEEKIRNLILAISSDMLREGIEFKVDRDMPSGVSVKVEGEDLRVDLDEATISAYLVRNILPRYRRVIRGED